MGTVSKEKKAGSFDQERLFLLLFCLICLGEEMIEP